MKTNILIHKLGIYTVSIIVMVCTLVLVCAAPYTATAETITISNSTSISSSGDGTSHASVKTTINGVVVEDTVLDDSGSYNSHIETTDGTTVVHTTMMNNHDAEIIALLEKLRALLHSYVSLLNQQH